MDHGSLAFGVIASATIAAASLLRAKKKAALKAAAGAGSDPSPKKTPSCDSENSIAACRASHGGCSVTKLDGGIGGSDLLLLDVPNLKKLCPDNDSDIPNRGPLSVVTEETRSDLPLVEPFHQFIDEKAYVIGDIVRKVGSASSCRVFVRAGPRASLYFDPTTVKAAIITCGGLCPGLNNVIRELVETLWQGYGVRTIYGLRFGFWGFHTADALAGAGKTGGADPAEEPILLTPDVVASINGIGGTILGSNRGGHDMDVILAFLRSRGVNQVYIVGGDGTHRGAHAISTRCLELGLPVSIAAIPKTIDNDVDLIDRSFGFDTAFAEAQRAIQSAKVEASCIEGGIGIVKLMGRHAGFIAAHATLASGDVDVCLVPEVPVVLEGPLGVLTHVRATLKRKRSVVIVVAEGAAEDILEAEMIKKGIPIEVDAGGNKKLPAVGAWLQGKVKDYMATAGEGGKPMNHKIIYIDPSYMIRSVPANPADSVYCCVLAQSSVHGAMGGFTGFTTGLINNRVVYIPIPAITANSPRRLNPRGRTYERLLAITQQPDVLSDPAVAAEVAKKAIEIAAHNAASASFS